MAMVSATLGLADQDRLEAALERGILLDVLPVFVERGGTDHVQLAPGERRLEQVARIHRPLRRPRAHDRVQLVDEDDVPPLGLGQLLDHRLEPLLEFATILGAGQQQADVERHDLLAAQRLRHVPVDDALGQPFDDRGLADAGLADQDRIVLGAAGKHLHHPAHLLVTTDDGIQLSLAGLLGEVPREALQRLVLLLGGLVGHPVGAPHPLERVPQRPRP